MARPSQQVDLGSTLQTEQATAYEQANVHAVYDVIANHFSSTRYKPWPLIPQFLQSLATGSVGADLGCGNGKYLHLRSALGPQPDASIVTLGSDRCEPLINDAQHNFPEHGEKHTQEVAVADALCSQLRSAALDYAISIATIHHFSTSKRRMRAVQELIRVIKPVKHGQYSNDDLGEGSGRFLIFVWAYEQRGGGRRKFDSVLADSENTQDVLVPWVMTSQHTNQRDTEEVHQRCAFPN
ncbi:tRNA (carboxymethyluridine(34)-5-O)-methyltransferase [Malassezia yamatoensis]|uniref:tRNA (Carboxymethyluridine(34)-5-O)-methyltransferase n=1 Tax=Malassezia yamatoensis TaxID=253288 RepID=A0AAJ5YVJ6_9BASI|nr:tRNA (carboxymethyluridine(34)-5-O)-methyltransferase [Malassezia yamatoensis]